MMFRVMAVRIFQSSKRATTLAGSVLHQREKRNICIIQIKEEKKKEGCGRTRTRNSSPTSHFHPSVSVLCYLEGDCCADASVIIIFWSGVIYRLIKSVNPLERLPVLHTMSLNGHFECGGVYEASNLCLHSSSLGASMCG